MASRFRSLSYWLLQHQPLWRTSVFVDSSQNQPSWTNEYPGLWDALKGLSLDSIERFKQSDSALLAYLMPHLTALAYYPYFCSLTQNTASKVTHLPNALATGMPGNKLAQVEQFVSGIKPNSSVTSWVEWCSGKGYLGRLLGHRFSQPITSLEWQQELVDKGQQFACEHHLPMTLIQQDVFEHSASEYVRPHSHCVALHACGDLHVRLVELAAHNGASGLNVAPCCYHLIRGDGYAPLSTLGQAHDLRLSKNELRIPLQQTVTGGERVKRHRLLEMRYRLGLDELLRAELGKTEHTPIPSIKKSQLDGGFEAFCLWACDKKQITLPEGVDFDHYATLGEARYLHMERLSLAQQLFQRPLEMWLALDKCQFLEEHGYTVSLSAFCEASLTPRNLFISASK